MTPIISVRNLGKRYWIGTRVTHNTLRESLMAAVSAPFCRGPRANGDCLAHIWALRGVTFDVMPGEILGVIGRNGAGKSTVLKILSRITEPTEGEVDLRGRVASLLEVGTGFHSELSGRENIYINGAILGMKRAEIASRFDEIVAFSGVEKFIDTPVKRYSSGMYVRLAFAVAAHLQPEILLVDEVLAVGDAQFQKKCVDKMGEVARGGRTVVFVSHDMAAIESLCDRCLLIKSGELADEGVPINVVEGYVASLMPAESARASLVRHPGRTSSSDHSMTSVTLASDAAEPVSAVRMGATLRVKIFFARQEPITPVMGVIIKNRQGVPLLSFNNLFIGGYRFERASGGTITCEIERIPLMPGTYLIDLWLTDGEVSVDVVNDAISFEVQPADVFGTGKLPPSGSGQIVYPAAFNFRAN